MAKVTEYSRITKMKDNDILLVDGPDGTRTILKSNAAKDLGGDIIAVTKSSGKDKVTLNLTDSPIGLATENDLNEVADALLPIGTASGNPAVVTDAKIGTTFRDVKIGIEPMQSGSGDPSPSNVRPISGWTGANIRVSPTDNPADGRTYSVEFPSEAGIVYGGVLDLTSGTLTVDRAYMSLTGAESTWLTSGAYEKKYFGVFVGDEGDGVTGSGVCSHFSPINTDISTTSAVGQRMYSSSAYHRSIFAFRPENVTDMSLADFREWVADQAEAETPLQISWKLAQTQVYAVNPEIITVLAGVNNVFADCGPVEVAYVKDVKIEEMIAEESDGTASRAFTVGEYVIVKDKLYKVTADISAGAELVPGTNVEETTVGEELNEIGGEASNVSELKTQMNNLKPLGFYEVHDPINTTLVEGRINAQTGAIVTGSFSHMSLPVSQGDVITFYSCLTGNGSPYGCAFYDSNGTYLTGMSISNEENKVITVPKNAATFKYGMNNAKWQDSVYNIIRIVNANTDKVFNILADEHLEENSAFAIYLKKFHLNANTVHPSTNDRLDVDIKNGEKYVVFYDRKYTNALQIIACDSSNNDTTLFTSTNKNGYKLLVAGTDIAKIGVAVSSNSNVDDYSFAVAKEGSAIYQVYKNADDIIGTNDELSTAEEKINRNAENINMEVSRNLIGADLDTLYPVPPLRTGDVLTISAFNPSSVTDYAQVRFHDSAGERITYYQFSESNASTGRTVTLELNDSIAYYISVWHDCGSPLMVELGNTKTDFIPHYITNYEKYLDNKSNFGEFELYLPEQANIIKNNLATARMTKRLCFGHTSDNHSTLYQLACDIIDMSDAKFIVNTGDMVIDKYTDSYTIPNMINAMTKPNYITLGNHDVYQAPSTSDIFSKYFTPIITHNGQTGLDKTYYSVDFSDEKIKCVFLDPYDALADYSASMTTVIAGKMSATQINWLFGELDDALTNSMHVCLFLHLSPEIVGEHEEKFYDVNTTDSKYVTYTFLANVIDAFMDGDSVTFTYDGNSYSHTFTSSGVFVGYFCGHMHCDCVGKLKTHERQNAFSVARPWQSPSATDEEGIYRHGSSKWGFSAFNYVTVDPNTRHVSIMRVLQQETKYGFKRDFMTAEY